MLHHQITRGRKIPLVFLHGYCEDLTMWEDFTKVFEEHTILAIDLPGFGKSPTYDGLSIESMAEEVHQAMKHLEIEDSIVIGHSMGGYVAVALSRLLGKRLKGLCMFHAHPFEDLPETKEKRDRMIAFVEEYGVPAMIKILVPTFFAPRLKGQFTDRIGRMIEAASSLSIAAVNNAMLAMRDRSNLEELIADLACPYHCILGVEDLPTPFDLCLPQISLPKVAKLTILPDIGHMGMFSATEQTQVALNDFISYCEQKQ